MKSAKSWLIVLFALTTACGGFFAWRQHSELATLRAAPLPRDERAEFQKRVWDLEKSNRELKNQVAPHSEGAARSGDAGPGVPAPRGGAAGAASKADQKFDAMRDLVAKPEVQALIQLQQHGAIESRYAALFRNLNLPPDQIAKLTALLAERTASLLDVSAVARDQGLDPRSNPAAFQQMIAATQEEINRSIKGVIGEAGFAQLTGFERTLPQRNTVGELQQRLSYTATPLTNTQAEQLAQILAVNPPPLPTATAASSSGATPKPAVRTADFNATLGTLLGGGADAVRPVGLISPAAVTQAQGVLSPPQLTALQQLQQQQQAQMQLRKIVAETFNANPPPPAPSGGKR